MGSRVSKASTSPSEMDPVQLPRGYDVLEVLGEGYFGKVLKCWKKDIKQTVAVKIPKCFENDTVNEVSMLRRFKRLKLHQHNIVEFMDCFQTRYGKAMVLEVLDITLGDYLGKTSFVPMLVSDIRSIIQQMGTAFEALKGIGVIHADLHLHNIMIENHQTRPFRVKLIDFGVAMSRSEASQGKRLQPMAFRSPEILLGCPFSEAIDMWSLGCLMFIMICGKLPFSGRSEYEILRSIIDLLGQPEDLVLSTGLQTKKYFNWTESSSWELKTSFEYFRCHLSTVKDHKLQSLDDLKKMRLEENNGSEAAERDQCIELLKAMLKTGVDERITPREVLTHPFITKDYPNNGTEKSETSHRKMMRPKAAVLSKRRPACPTTAPPFTLHTSHIPPAGVILVRPATAENTLLLEGQGSEVSGRSYIDKTSGCSAFTSPFSSEDSTPSPTFLSSGVVILVRPATAQRSMLGDQESAVSFQSGLYEASVSLVTDVESGMESSICEASGSCENTGAENEPGKKKNFLRRVFSWMRKTFRPCVPSVDGPA
ncbi:homeodomain-interacting protein kinase 2-like [Sparus aurata]|uniref:homeodomain-interacting protein kinase 2-like n=1 Tax=Sparus aurata TaxID=8175 RepID=UPI0011C0EA84|nr:homeodomain-interacting protein kinase 2-like [Sparus aurata]XP_030282905.1 homeodomain-interacting protein kinase 2-like [Sparus aurata]XP_030282906.1 homeodomain-interacting protein kinase 2-like [Sparus aurata]XP_030282907.1 homeodomain-interacting protein kinase 2-like [Sparus aurata]XP_030282909.1 homeodomain-interacting protein kinase 2-like [Sparus aurata]XP_030282910.1 homeodomain-interacting protein kinase 2-like [Sparus aurata]XP_030282911.1 homeodomain-interacting protein kinase